MKKCVLATLILAITQPAFAIREYHKISKSLRAQGMGGAFYALSNDEYALFYNPAGLSFYDEGWQLMLPINLAVGQNAISKYSSIVNAFQSSGSISTVASNLDPLRNQPFSLNAGLFPFYLQQNFAIGLLLADTKANFDVIGAGIDTSLRVAAMSDSGLVVGYGRSVGHNLHVGLNTKFIVRAGGKKTYSTTDIAQSSSSSLKLTDLGGVGGGIDFDLGAIYEVPEGLFPWALGHRFSLTVTNLLASSFGIAAQGNAPQLPRYVSLGSYTIFKGIGPINNFIFLLDFAEFGLGGQSDEELGARSGSFWKHVNLGLEMPMGHMFALRTGFRQGNFTLGLGLNLKYFKLDFAWYAEELGTKVGTNSERRLGLRLAFGGGALNESAIDASSISEHRQRLKDVARARDEAGENEDLKEDGKKKGAAKELVDRLQEAEKKDPTAGDAPQGGTEPPQNGTDGGAADTNSSGESSGDPGSSPEGSAGTTP
ncbi:MAG: hypothetical protein KDD51_08490 [Bdellovibrionales bacterium]|nr:hypothetical protein [Bdellovibrionales bacterium]